MIPTAKSSPLTTTAQLALQQPFRVEREWVERLKKRDVKNNFYDIWTTTIDPADMFVDRSKRVAPAPVITIQKAGEPEAKVDFLILGDGYTAAEAKKFEADA